jgi:hypothetical protein
VPKRSGRSRRERPNPHRRDRTFAVSAPQERHGAVLDQHGVTIA